MRFIHIADVHLGAKPDAGSAYGPSRGGEIWTSLERIVDICRDEEIELLLIAGDLFHRQPLLKDLKEVNYLFTTIPSVHIVIIAGNHDRIRNTSALLSFSWCSNVTFFMKDQMESVYFEDCNVEEIGRASCRERV